MTRYLLLLSTGPCIGSYETARAPLGLRAVRDRVTGKRDVLDLQDDRPEPGEDAFVYRRDPGGPRGHVCMRGPTRCLQSIAYEYVGPLDLETGAIAELTDEDRAWWAEQGAAALRAWALGDEYAIADPPANAGRLF